MDQNLHDARSRRRRGRGDGDDATAPPDRRNLRLHHRTRHSRNDGWKEEKTSSACAPADTSEVLFDNCRIPADQLLGKRGTWIREQHAECSMPDASASPHWRSDSRRAHEDPLCVREAATGVWQDDQPVSGDSVEAGRQRHANRGRATADLSRRVAERSPPPDDARVGRGEALCERNRRESRR